MERQPFNDQRRLKLRKMTVTTLRAELNSNISGMLRTYGKRMQCQTRGEAYKETMSTKRNPGHGQQRN